jgi:choline-sulfatase
MLTIAGMVAALGVSAPFAAIGALLPSLGLTATLGVLGSLVLALGLAGVQRLPRRVAPWAAVAIGCAVGYCAVARPLGAVDKVSGEHATMAWFTLLGAVFAGGAAVWSVWWVRPRDAGEHPARRCHAVVRVALPLAVGTLALALCAFEASQAWLANYPAAQQVLVGGAWLLASWVCLWLFGALPALEAALPRSAAGALAALLVLDIALWRADASALAAMVRASHLEHWVKLGRALSDWDRDGVSSWLGGGDCAPFDAQVSPRQREIADNGVDDNCRHGDAAGMPELAKDVAPQLASAGAASDGVGPSAGRALDGARARAPNLVLITVDTLRADHTTPYGHHRDTTPHLQRFAQSALQFDTAYTSGGWTCLALPSLFAGVYPRRLEWKPVAVTSTPRMLDFPWREQLAPGERQLASLTLPKHPPRWWLPSALQRAGYRTIAVPSHAIQHFGGALANQGWDEVRVPAETGDRHVADLATQWLASEARGPFFLWVHFYDPHEPQTEHPGVPTFGVEIEDKYDHEVAAMDAQLGRLLAALEGMPQADTAVIVTADHGEVFQWGFQFHGTDLFEDNIRIPLWLRAPGLQPARVNTPASLVDIAPTLLAIAGLTPPRGLDGADLRALSPGRVVFTDLFRVDDEGRPKMDLVAVTNTRQRWIRDNMKQLESLVRVHDYARPPKLLDLDGVEPALLDALSRYDETAAGR